MPDYIAMPRFRRTFRYVHDSNITSGSTFDVSSNDILDQWFYATSTTAGNRFATAFKLHAVHVWVPSDPLLAIAAPSIPVQFSWDNTGSAGVGAPSTTHQITNPGIGVLHRRFTPPRGSNAAMWHSATSDAVDLFALTTQPGCFWQLDLEFVFPEGTGGGVSTQPSPVVSAISGATVGNVYVRGFPCGSATLIPVGLTEI